MQRKMRKQTTKTNLTTPGHGRGDSICPRWTFQGSRESCSTSTAIVQEQSPAVYAGLFIVVFFITGVVTMALQCAEPITVLTRGEVTWRHCASKSPYTARQNAAVRAATSWSCVTRFLLKVVLYWISGKGVSYAYNWGVLWWPQLLYLSVGMAVLAAFANTLCLKSPNAPQPATFGHVQDFGGSRGRLVFVDVLGP